MIESCSYRRYFDIVIPLCLFDLWSIHNKEFNLPYMDLFSDIHVFTCILKVDLPTSPQLITKGQTSAIFSTFKQE